MQKPKRTERLFSLGDKITCKSNREMRNVALLLSSDGYGVAILGYSNLVENTLTITAMPKEAE